MGGKKAIVKSHYFITAREGYVFTRVCHSVHGGGGSAARGVPGPRGRGGLLRGGAWSGGGSAGGGGSGGVPGPGGVCGYPAVTATAAGGTHPTGIHSCYKNIYLLHFQGKVMFSQVSVCPGRGNVGYLWSHVPARSLVPCLFFEGEGYTKGVRYRGGRDEVSILCHPPGSGSHCSGRYASYWNAVLFGFYIILPVLSWLELDACSNS